MEDLLNDLFKIKNYHYRMWKYDRGHSTLTLRATNTQKEHHNIHITFINVRYVQFPLGWKGDLYLAPDNEWSDFLKRSGIHVPDASMKKNFPSLRLYKADDPDNTIYILGILWSIEYDVEPIYN